jgi:hypothetical protein
LQLVHAVDDLAQVVAALDLVADLAENLADLVFDGVRAAGALLEAVQVGAELEVDEVPEVVTGERLVVVDLAALGLRCRPFRPAVGGIEDLGVFPPLQLRLGGFVGFEGIEVFQEQEPGALLGVIQFAGASGVLVEDVVDVFEGLFEHVECLRCIRSQ